MQKAIDLSLKGIGLVNPNPLVGAVIIKNNKIIGQGFHEAFGQDHAEVNAINNASEDCSGATIYVTLEPCSHYGKTPPCALKIIEHGFKNVIIGMRDPNPLVAGRGIQLLKDAGINVETGILENEIKKINEVFVHYIIHKTPFVVMKTASTFDGKIATKSGNTKWISGSESQKFVHELRHKYSGIMIGINTVINDNPQLNIRHLHGEIKNPTKIIIDSKAAIPLNSKIINNNDGSKIIIAVTEKATQENIEKIEKKGANIIVCPSTKEGVDLKYLMTELGKLSIDSILLEGGGTLNFSALKQGIVKKVINIIAPKIIGGANAPSPVDGSGIEDLSNSIKLKNLSSRMLGDDIVVEAEVLE
jgi:diaminohydroxyphosphoribosylaminopyrimidine deaminase/5-amino-6-(5-phosphoribosylamino)uracil reductase